MRSACVVALLLFGCAEPKKASGEPCTKNSECEKGLICDSHAGGSNTCEGNHDHSGDTTVTLETDSATTGTTTTDSATTDATTMGTGATDTGATDTSTSTSG